MALHDVHAVHSSIKNAKNKYVKRTLIGINKWTETQFKSIREILQIRFLTIFFTRWKLWILGQFYVRQSAVGAHPSVWKYPKSPFVKVYLFWQAILSSTHWPTWSFSSFPPHGQEELPISPPSHFRVRTRWPEAVLLQVTEQHDHSAHSAHPAIFNIG